MYLKTNMLTTFQLIICGGLRVSNLKEEFSRDWCVIKNDPLLSAQKHVGLLIFAVNFQILVDVAIYLRIILTNLYSSCKIDTSSKI